MEIDLNLINNDNLKPREEVRIENVTAAPLADRQRVKVEIAITPFRERPNLEVAIVNAAGQRVASTSVIATMNFKMGLVLHLRGGGDPAGNYSVHVTLYFDDTTDPHDQRATAFRIESASPV